MGAEEKKKVNGCIRKSRNNPFRPPVFFLLLHEIIQKFPTFLGDAVITYLLLACPLSRRHLTASPPPTVNPPPTPTPASPRIKHLHHVVLNGSRHAHDWHVRDCHCHHVHGPRHHVYGDASFHLGRHGYGSRHGQRLQDFCAWTLTLLIHVIC